MLATPDSFATIALHPAALAGFAGIVINALNLIPIGSTDGGRASLALFGRGDVALVQGAALLLSLLCGLFGSDTLLFYTVIVCFTQNDLEYPCREEITEVSTSRVLTYLGLSVVAALALFPLPINVPGSL